MINKRSFKCTDCGKGKPCFLQTNQEPSIVEEYEDNRFKCVLDQSSCNWVEISNNEFIIGETKFNEK